MLVLERDGSLEQEPITICMTSPERGVIDVPADVALQRATLIDQLIDVMFNLIGLSNLEIRVHESSLAEKEPLAHVEEHITNNLFS